MNPQESQLDYPFGDALPVPGKKREIAPGIYWIRKRFRLRSITSICGCCAIASTGRTD